MGYNPKHLISDCIALVYTYGVEHPIDRQRLLKRNAHRPTFITGEHLKRIQICGNMLTSGAWGGYISLIDAIYINPKIPTHNDKLHTVFHELVHSTMHSSRLDRIQPDSCDKQTLRGATEECTAILGSVLLSAATNNPFDEDREYIIIENLLMPFYREQRESIIICALTDTFDAVKYLIDAGDAGNAVHAWGNEVRL